MSHRASLILLMLGLYLGAYPSVRAQSTAFSYQGLLASNGAATNGWFDLRFTLFDKAALDGVSVGVPALRSNVWVQSGLFSTMLDFGAAAFDGAPRWIEVAVRRSSNASPFTVLSPRQPVGTMPYALRSDTADHLSGSLPANQLPATAARLNTVQTFAGTNTFAPPSGPPFVVASTGRVTNLNADLLDGLQGADFWQRKGNTGTVAGTDFLGTRDNQPLELKVNATRGWRLEPGTNSPNVVGGSISNSALAGIGGATIAGGGATNSPNVVADHFGAVGGGLGNQARGRAATVPGGSSNSAAFPLSLAAGNRAKAQHPGAFVWADGSSFDFASTASNQFAVRAGGGADFVTSLNAQGARQSGVTLSATGGVAVTSLNVTNPALELRLGALKVTGADATNAQTPVFVHRAKAGNIVGYATVIDHPLCNNDPRAILLVTHNGNPGDTTGNNLIPNYYPVGVFFTGSVHPGFTAAHANRWVIFNADTSPMTLGAAFNVMVVKP